MFELVDSPKIFPQRSITGSTVGPMVDMQVVVPKSARVYISRLEAAEIGRLFGMLSTEASAQKEARIAQLEREIADARAALARIRTDLLAVV